MIWTDAFGLRPTIRTIAKRLAAEGYAVLAPNPYYRTANAPVIDNPSQFDFSNADSRAKMQTFSGPLQADGAAERDASSYVAFLDAQKEVEPSKKIGVQGYCMGGPLVLRTAAAIPNRIGAGASFHGGSLVTTATNSPHLLIPKIKAQMLIAIAEGDDMREPTTKDTLRKAFDDAKVKAEIEVYPGTLHGWCISDMPLQNGKPIYNMKEAERAWTRLLALYKTALA
jgi:carboxymethylenebutenolidase